jgi:hypothetical protein
VNADVVNEGGVVAAGRVHALKRNRVRPGRDGERGGDIALIGRAGRGKGPHDGAVDQHVEILVGREVVAALGGVEGDQVRAGGPAGDALAKRAGLMEDGNL